MYAPSPPPPASVPAASKAASHAGTPLLLLFVTGVIGCAGVCTGTTGATCTGDGEDSGTDWAEGAGTLLEGERAVAADTGEGAGCVREVGATVVVLVVVVTAAG